MIVKNLKQLEKELNKRIKQSLTNDVLPVVENTMYEHIIEDVYNAYVPVMYERRYEDWKTTFNDVPNTGLLDKENIQSDIYSTTLITKNITLGARYYYIRKKNGEWEQKISENYKKPIDGIIESGIGYDVKSPGPRPFIENTRIELRTSKSHVKALKKGLKKQGLEVK